MRTGQNSTTVNILPQQNTHRLEQGKGESCCNTLYIIFYLLFLILDTGIQWLCKFTVAWLWASSNNNGKINLYVKKSARTALPLRSLKLWKRNDISYTMSQFISQIILLHTIAALQYSFTHQKRELERMTPNTTLFSQWIRRVLSTLCLLYCIIVSLAFLSLTE